MLLHPKSHFVALLLASGLLFVAAGCQTATEEETGTTSGPLMIENTTWQLSQVFGKPAEPVPADAKAAHFRLNGADKRVSGFTGINQFGGSYELRGSLLKFGPLAMTRKAGPTPLMQQEASFAQALHDTSTWRVADANSIELLDSSEKVLAKLARAEN